MSSSPFLTLRRTHTFFSLINAVCIFISKCNLFRLCSYLNVCFRADHLVSDNQWGALPWRAPPPKPSSVLCGPSCRVETSWAFPSSLACVLMSPLFSLSGSHSCETVGLASDVPRKHNLTANSMILCLQLSRPLFCRIPRALGEGVFCRGICWGCGSQLPLDWLWIFCGGLSLLQRSLCDEV